MNRDRFQWQREAGTDTLKVDTDVIEVLGMHTIGRGLALGPEVMRFHYYRETGHFVRECEKKHKRCS